MRIKTSARALLLLLSLSFSWSNPLAAEEVKPPKIVALAPHIVELLFEIGAGDQIVATTAFADYPVEAKQIPTIGSYLRLNIEQIVSLSPDLIIAWRDGNPATDLARLEKLGMIIEYSHPTQLSDIPRELRWLGKLTGKTSKADYIAKQFEQQYAALATLYSEKHALNVFYELWGNPLSTIGDASWPAQHLAACGVKNAFHDALSDYPQVNIEQVLSRDVDVIVQPLSINQTDKTGFDWSDWPEIKAVKHQQIIRPDADKIHRMTSRTLTELAALCQSLDLARQFYLNKAK